MDVATHPEMVYMMENFVKIFNGVHLNCSISRGMTSRTYPS